ALRPPRAPAGPAALLREVDGDARPPAGGGADVPRALEGSSLMASRADFFARVRREVGRTNARFPASTAERPPRPAEAAEVVRREMAGRWPAALERFREEFERVAGVFHRAATLAEVPAIVLGIARDKGARELVAWDRAALGIDLAPALGAAGLPVQSAAPG